MIKTSTTKYAPMPKHIWSVLCRRGVVDAETNVLSIDEVLEKVTLTVKKESDTKEAEQGGFIFPLAYELMSFFQVEGQKKWEMKLEYLNSKGKLLTQNTYPLESPEKSTRFRYKVQISGLSVKENGDYLFRISLRSTEKDEFKVVAEIPLEVEVIIS